MKRRAQNPKDQRHPDLRLWDVKETGQVYALFDSVSTLQYDIKEASSSMGTKFRIPVLGGNLLDLHRLFVEVTKRGGVEKQHVPHPPNHEAAMPPQPQRIGITVPEGPSIISGEIDDTFESEYLITVKSDFEDFFYHQIPMNQELQNQDLPASTTTAKVGISKQTPRGKKFINN
ncbi:hypothetical protein FXO38_21285 [Capsicum annuum]|uniref:ARID domain-containing protein n=1 Tax=Capsicum annuum TaxID=4072 RepID=A0A2G2ZPS2_CAPAN|nr:hypothetical protein FXO38_21285 [Capsicum annuum]KAF3678233.1 hypothetical protein FXO37_04480 [Capsicum annuum]PHT83955.1 hypothetical protein T459_12398 [Capsicum annuum]